MCAQVVWEALSQRISIDFRFEHGKPDPHKTPPIAMFRKGRPFRKESTRSSEETSKKYENRLKNRPEERTRSQRRKTSKIGLQIHRKLSNIDARIGQADPARPIRPGRSSQADPARTISNPPASIR